VEEYFAFAVSALEPDGLLYSLNAHGKAEITWPSEYPVDSLRLVKLRSPRRLPFLLAATIPYELVLTPAPGTGSEPGVETGLDAICSAMQLGLDDDLELLCDRFAAGALDPGEAAWLEDLAGLFRASDAAAKANRVSRLEASGLHAPATSYLSGALAYATGDLDGARLRLVGALEALSSPLARLHAEGMLGTLAPNAEARDAHYRRAIAIAPHLEGDLAGAIRSYPGYAGHIASQLRLVSSPSVRSVAAGVRERVRRLIRRQ
jgi:hypothetical protein